MSSEHVEVLERLRGVLDHGKMGDKCLIAPDLVEKVIAALSAPQPPAEAQPVAWQFQDRDGRWHGFMDERHRLNTIADGSWPVRALYTAHPSAPVGVEGFDEWFDEYTKNNYTDEMLALAAWKQALAQQPSACVGCEGKPAPENSPCNVCGQQPAAVDSEMVTRAVNAYDEATGEGWQMPCLQGMRAALTAALATQPEGPDNDR